MLGSSATRLSGEATNVSYVANISPISDTVRRRRSNDGAKEHHP